MSPLSQRVTLDASAVLAWVLRERGFETIDKVLPVAVVPVSAMVEVLYRAVERGTAWLLLNCMLICSRSA